MTEKIQIEGILMMADKVTTNNNLYPKEELEKAAKQLVGKPVTMHNGYGDGNNQPPVIGKAKVVMDGNILKVDAEIDPDMKLAKEIQVGDSIGPTFTATIENVDGDIRHLKNLELISISYCGDMKMSQDCMKITKVTKITKQ